MQKLILASTSTYRKTLLEKLALPFSCESPNIEETPLSNETPKALALRLATEKAEAVAKRHHDAVIIGSDQTAEISGAILGKPGDHAKAMTQLLMASGKTVRFFTGLCVLNAKTKQRVATVETFDVTFRKLDEKQIDYYLKTEKPYDCAGSFKSEGLGIALFTSLNGRDPNALVGLPLIALCDMLREIGIDVLKN